jgi:hypothetical protein
LIDWHRTQRPECGAAVFHWHAWDDVGMAVRPESKHIRKLHNIKFMPSQEGADHLINELCAGLPEGEIVITELQYCKQKYADAAAAAAMAPAAAANDVASLPMIDAVTEWNPGVDLTAEVHLDPAADTFLVQHRFKGSPMMPVVMTLESMAQAATLAAGEGRAVVALKNIEIVNGPEQGYELAPPEPAGDREFVDCWYPEEDLVIWHGPEFRCLRQVAVQEDFGWGKLVAPATVGNLGGARQGENPPCSTRPSSPAACTCGSGSRAWSPFRPESTASGSVARPCRTRTASCTSTIAVAKAIRESSTSSS